MTPREQQVLDRFRQAVHGHRASDLVRVRAGDVTELLNLLWGETQRADVAEAWLPEGQREELVAAAENRLDALLGPEFPDLPLFAGRGRPPFAARRGRAAAATG